MTLPTTTIAGITVCDTPLVQAAVENARVELPPPLFNHVMRSWLFAAYFAHAECISVDEEILAISAIMHVR